MTPQWVAVTVIGSAISWAVFTGCGYLWARRRIVQRAEAWIDRVLHEQDRRTAELIDLRLDRGVGGRRRSWPIGDTEDER